MVSSPLHDAGMHIGGVSVTEADGKGTLGDGQISVLRSYQYSGWYGTC